MQPLHKKLILVKVFEEILSMPDEKVQELIIGHGNSEFTQLLKKHGYTFDTKIEGKEINKYVLT